MNRFDVWLVGAIACQVSHNLSCNPPRARKPFFDDFVGWVTYQTVLSVTCISNPETLSELQTVETNCSLYPKTSSWRGKFPTFSVGWTWRKSFVAIWIPVDLSSGLSPRCCDLLTFVIPFFDHDHRDCWNLIERGRENIHFPCSADHEQVDPYSCYCVYNMCDQTLRWMRGNNQSINQSTNSWTTFCSHWSLVDVPLISFCPADHLPDYWQPRIVVTGMVEARDRLMWRKQQQPPTTGKLLVRSPQGWYILIDDVVNTNFTVGIIILLLLYSLH